MNKINIKVLNIIIAVLAVICVISTIELIYQVYDYNETTTYDEDFLSSYMQNNVLDHLYINVLTNELNNVKPTEHMKDIYYTARYYNAAQMYHSYKVSGDIQLADEKQDLMHEYALKMGDYAFCKARIDGFFDTLYD